MNRLGMSLFFAAAVCPLGANQNHLTIHQVMINFGHYTMDADSLALKDVSPEVVVTDAQISDVIQKLGVAQACADAVIKNPTGDLLPDSASMVTGAQRAKLISDFVSYMTEFRDQIGDYAQDFNALLATKADARNFDAVYEDSQGLDELVTRAHRQTSFDGDPQPAPSTAAAAKLMIKAIDIGQIMKTIGTQFSGIRSSVSDAAQNAANAQNATQLANLFGSVLNEIPDAIQNLPADQKPDAIADYKRLVQLEIDSSNQLAAAFQQGNNTIAATIVSQMSRTKLEGHQKYNP